MGIIQCALNCRHQKDGYCFMDTATSIKSADVPCPFFEKTSADNTDCLTQSADPYNININI